MLLPLLSPKRARSTHIARKLDGEGGSPRYMAPECYDASLGKLTERRFGDQGTKFDGFSRWVFTGV